MSNAENLILFPEVEIIARRLTPEQFGHLMLSILAYRFREEPYNGSDSLVALAFDVVANQIDRGRDVSQKRAQAGRSPKKPEANANKAEQTETKAAPVQSNPVQSNPIQSNPVQSSPVQDNTQKNIPSTKSNPGKGAAAPQTERKKSYGKFGWVKLEPREYEALKAELGEGELDRCITFLDEAAQCTGNKNRWKDFGLVIQRCSREGWGIQPYVKRQEPIPRGASGELGAAELEAIQTMLRQKEERL